MISALILFTFVTLYSDLNIWMPKTVKLWQILFYKIDILQLLCYFYLEFTCFYKIIFFKKM